MRNQLVTHKISIFWFCHIGGTSVKCQDTKIDVKDHDER